MSTALRRYDFSERLADILGESRRDLRVRVTLLISGGLIPPGPRGPGAPPATADYAADLLIGVMAAPLQVHTVDAVRCYRALLPTRLAAGDGTSGIVIGAGGRARLNRPSSAVSGAVSSAASGPRPSFGEAVARLLALAHAEATRALVARDVFGVWLARGFPVAAIQLATWTDEGRSIVSQRYELAPSGQPPAWLDPERGGNADPGLNHSVFLPVDKLIQIGALITPSDDIRMPPVIDLGQKIASLANLAQLARETRHRRPWQSFLSAAAAAEDTATRIDARDAGLVEVFDFGGNPGNVRMLTHVPDDLPKGAALVVVLHGCTQTAASYDRGTGWSTLADRHGFALLFPEQRRANNPLRCFNWFRAEDHVRDSGEALSIRQMVDRMIADHGIDPGRVYVTGLSAGGAMTSVLLATYPDVFAGGAILSAVPYKAAVGLQEAFDAIFQGKSLPAEEWAARVRAASPHPGPWPRVQVWHGEADATVKPINQAEIVKQWTAVHGLAAAPSVESMVDGHRHRVWRDAEGRDLVESYTVGGMAHGAAIDPHGPDGVGQPQPFIVDAGISSTWHIARSWGLTATRRDPRPKADRPSRPQRRERSEQPAPVILLSPPAADPTGEAPRVVEPDEIVPPSSRNRDEAHRDKAGRAEAGARAGASAGAEEGTAGIDVMAIITRSFELAGLIEPAPDGAPRKASTAPLGIDIPGILATSFEAAGLFKRARADRNPPRSPHRPATPQHAEDTPSPPSEAAAAPRREREPSTPDRLDLQTILTRSFEASGLLRTVAADAPADAVTADAPAAVTPGSHGGWQLIPGGGEDNERAELLGRVSSGRDGIGLRAKSIDCRIDLGDRPRLSYSRRLDLRAALNPFTAAAFAVLVDGEPVDEVAANGMDYAEDDWLRRADIDLARFAGRTATLTFTVEANSNLYKEVCAQAWVREIVIDEASPMAAGTAASADDGEGGDELLAPI